MTHVFQAAMDITCTKAPHTDLGPTLTTMKLHERDEFVRARIYGLEILRHGIGGRPSCVVEILEINMRNPLNDHAEALLVIVLEFRELTEDDIPKNEENLHFC